jgi:hypothetical protein
MYIGQVTLGRRKHIQLSHYCLTLILLSIKFIRENWKSINRKVLIKLQKNSIITLHYEIHNSVILFGIRNYEYRTVERVDYGANLQGQLN